MDNEVHPGRSSGNLLIDLPHGTMILDLDVEGRVLGIEVLGADASLTRATRDHLADLTRDQPEGWAELLRRFERDQLPPSQEWGQ